MSHRKRASANEVIRVSGKNSAARYITPPRDAALASVSELSHVHTFSEPLRHGKPVDYVSR